MKERLTILREKANNLPMLPGVYIMQDEDGNVIYVGKAKKLKNRVTGYFRGEHNSKVQAMADKVHDFSVIIARSEFEALVLENRLIKKHMPHYNILLKDDKGYPFIRVDMREDYPRMNISSRDEHDGARYFGPYGGRDVTREIIRSVSRTLMLPDCGRKFGKDKASRPCLNYQMGRCDGWCRETVGQEEYKKRFEQAILLLEGKSAALVENLTAQMLRAADELRFENAALLRDRIKKVESLGNTQRVTKISFSGSLREGYGKRASRYFKVQDTDDNETRRAKGLKPLELLGKMLSIENFPHRIDAFDVSNLGDSGIVAAMTVHIDGKPVKREYRKFRIRDLEIRDDYASMYQAVYRRFNRYLNEDEKFSELPDLLLIDGGRTHAETALKALRELGLQIPVFGMVKDDRHRTRALVSPDGQEISISGNQSVFVLIGRIQEETHRFAIEYQGSLRYEKYGSVIDRIPGIGEKRKTKLLQRFKTVKAVKEAGLDELSKILPASAAQSVYNYFHAEEKQ